MIAHQDNGGLRLKKNLLDILRKEILASGVDSASGITIHFRDPNYSAEKGGFHPVEMAIDEKRQILYITDFAYVGSGPYVELAKELDFDFQYRVFQQFGIEYPLKQGAELFAMWQQNFVDYYLMGVYQVTLGELS